MSQFVIPAKSA